MAKTKGTLVAKRGSGVFVAVKESVPLLRKMGPSFLQKIEPLLPGSLRPLLPEGLRVLLLRRESIPSFPGKAGTSVAREDGTSGTRKTNPEPLPGL